MDELCCKACSLTNVATSSGDRVLTALQYNLPTLDRSPPGKLLSLFMYFSHIPVTEHNLTQRVKHASHVHS